MVLKGRQLRQTPTMPLEPRVRGPHRSPPSQNGPDSPERSILKRKSSAFPSLRNPEPEYKQIACHFVVQPVPGLGPRKHFQGVRPHAICRKDHWSLEETYAVFSEPTDNRFLLAIRSHIPFAVFDRPSSPRVRLLSVLGVSLSMYFPISPPMKDFRVDFL